MCIARLEELDSVISTLTSEPDFTGFSSASRVSAKGGVELSVEAAAHTARVTRINTHFREVFISAPCKLQISRGDPPQCCFWPATATRVESIPYRRPTEPSHPGVARPHRRLVRKSFSFVTSYLDFGPVHYGQFCAPCRIRRISTAFPRMR